MDITERALREYVSLKTALLGEGSNEPSEAALALSALGELAERRGDLQEAAKWYERASLARPSPKFYLRQARVHYKRGEWRACLDAFQAACTKTACPGDTGPESVEEAMVCANAATYELGHAAMARQNCPALRRLFPGDPGVENLCRVIEAPWTTPADPAGCGRFCATVSWRAPWETATVPPPRSKCTRRVTVAHDALYASEPVGFTCEPGAPHPLVVMTAPRPEPTLPATLNSLRAAGSDRWPWPKLLVSDGVLRTGSETLQALDSSGWTIRNPDPSPKGSAKTFVRALENALETSPNLELLTFVEDDVELCANALDYVRRVKVPGDVALVTWFTYEFPQEERLHEEAQRRGWRHPYSYGVPVLARRSTRNLVLAQCLTLTRDAVYRLLRCPRVRDWPQENGHDEMLAWALGDVPYAAHFPGLVQHEGGLCSAVAANRSASPAGRDPQSGARTSPYYVGRDFDALGLTPKNFTP